MDKSKLKKPYFYLRPGMNAIIGTYSVDNRDYSCKGDKIVLAGRESTPITLPGLEEWCMEYHRERSNYLNGVDEIFDQDEWNYAGLRLAIRLREVLPDDIELVYAIGDHDILI